MLIRKIDHLVITTCQIDQCLSFYESLGFVPKSAAGRYELYAGDFKINVHIKGQELLPHAGHVTPGSADLCFEIDNIDSFRAHLIHNKIEMELDTVDRTGVRGPMKSIYLRDPDHNLLEFCYYNKQ